MFTDTGTGGDSPSTKDVAKDEAGNVKDTAVGAGKEVAATAKEEAANVAARGQAAGQEPGQHGHVGAEEPGVHPAGPAGRARCAATPTSCRAWARDNPGSGPLTDLVQQAASRGSDIASWLEDREPADVLDELRRFARRRPVMFLALCGLAGVVAGRITRGAVAANTSVDSPSASPARAAYSDTSTTAYATDHRVGLRGADQHLRRVHRRSGRRLPTEAAYPTEYRRTATETTYPTETTSVEYADRGDPTR